VDGRRSYAKANEDSPIFPELRGLVEKTSGIVPMLRDAVKRTRGLKIDPKVEQHPDPSSLP
jgi:hypothetical protein